MSELPIVMAVDDSLVNRRLITAQLKGSNVAVAEFGDGGSALEFLRANYEQVGLLLLEISIHDIRGISVLNIILSEIETVGRLLPVVAYTAKDI